MKNFIRKGVLVLLVLMTFLGTGSTARAVTFPDKPPASDFFVDKANLLTPENRKTINETALSLLKEQRIPLFVVTIDSLSSYGASGAGIDGYARQLFNQWGIGSQDRNYGILLLVSVGDRKARIEFGAGFAHAHDAQSDDVMQSLIVPAFKRGDYSTGIVDGVRGLDSIARGLQLPMPSTPEWFWPVMLIGGFLIAAGIYNLFKNGKSGWAWMLIAGLAAAAFFMMRNSGNSNDSSGGFGGGSSGGGGSTGSW